MDTECPRCGDIVRGVTPRLCRSCRPIVAREMKQSRHYHEVQLARHFGRASKTRRIKRVQETAA